MKSFGFAALVVLTGLFSTAETPYCLAVVPLFFMCLLVYPKEK